MTKSIPTNIEDKIKAWYKGLPEITLPNVESEDGTHMEINVWELARFIDELIISAKIEELQLMLGTWLRYGDPDCGLEIDKRIKELAQLSNREKK